jgi:hypothetical protein
MTSIGGIPDNDVKAVWQGRYTFAPLSSRQNSAGSVVHFVSAIFFAMFIQRKFFLQGPIALGEMMNSEITATNRNSEQFVKTVR